MDWARQPIAHTQTCSKSNPIAEAGLRGYEIGFTFDTFNRDVTAFACGLVLDVKTWNPIRVYHGWPLWKFRKSQLLESIGSRWDTFDNHAFMWTLFQIFVIWESSQNPEHVCRNEGILHAQL